MDEKSKILRDFQGEISESVKVTRWGVPVSPHDDSTGNFFMQYAGGNTGMEQPSGAIHRTDLRMANEEFHSEQVLEQSRKQVTTTYNQMSGMDTGFRKFKNNQALTLKELKQEYEILRSLPVEERIPLSPKGGQQSSSSSAREDRSEASSKSGRTQQKRDHGSREVQMLALEKKQLQVVIGNSMRKIEELLHGEMGYKKQIHELKLQLDDRAPEEKYENVIRTLKKNEADCADTAEALKREIQRLKGVAKQQSQSICRLDSEILAKNQELMKGAQQRRRFDDLIRFEKDKYANVQIELKRLRMEAQIIGKDKGNEISRLMKQLQLKDAQFERDWAVKVRRLEDELHIRQTRYDLLLDQYEQMKKSAVPVEKKRERVEVLPPPQPPQPQPLQQAPQPQVSSQIEDLKKVLVEALADNNQSMQLKELLSKMEDAKQENRQLRIELKALHQQNMAMAASDPKKSQMFVDTISALFNKMDSSLVRSSDDTLKRDIQLLRGQVQSLHQRPDSIEKVRDQDKIIQGLQKIVEEYKMAKREFIEEIQAIRQQYMEVRETNQKIKSRLVDMIEKEKAYKIEISELRRESQIRQQDIEILQSAKGSFTSTQNELIELRLKAHHFEIMELQNSKLHQEISGMRASAKTRDDEYESEIRVMKRNLDEVTFEVTKLERQGTFNLDMERSTKVTEVNRLIMDIEKRKAENEHLLQEIEKMKGFYEGKMLDKNREINGVRVECNDKINGRTIEFDSMQQEIEKIHQSRIVEIQTVIRGHEEQTKIQGSDNESQRTRYEALLRETVEKYESQMLSMKQGYQAMMHSTRERQEFELVSLRERHDVLFQGSADQREGLIEAIQQRHERELQVLLRRLSALTDANEKFMVKSQQCMQMEGELNDLRKVLRQVKSMNDGVDHLWQIKETEYGNVNQILRHMRSGNMATG